MMFGRGVDLPGDDEELSILVRVRRIAGAGAVGTAWVALASLVLVGAMIAATSPAAPSPAAIEAQLESALDALGAPPRGPIAALSAGILDVLFGEGTSQRLLGGSGTATLTEPTPDGEPTTGPQPSPSPSPGSLPEQLTSPPDLRIRMSADRSTAGPGDTITYTIAWENAGRGRAENVLILTHIPEHTTWVGDNAVCVNPDREPDSGDEICAAIPATPPDTDTQGHFEVASYSSVGPGFRDTVSFTVLVNSDAPSGFVIGNHAHLRAAGVREQVSNEVSTLVN